MLKGLRLRMERGARRFLAQGGEYGVLRAHFFRRFFDNDVASPDGDTATAAAQAMMLTALPGMAIDVVILLFLLRPLPMAVGNLHDYFFVVYSFAGMGLLAVFEWEMLFADRLDFLILTPLPMQPRTMLRAKADALGRFLVLFLVSANLTGLLVPGMVGHNYFWVIAAHGVSAAMAGTFAVLLMLAAGGILLCVLDVATFRRILPVAQVMAVALLVWLVLQGKLFGMAMDMPKKMPQEIVRWLPPFWFLSADQWMLLGDATPKLVQQMARMGIYALAIVAAGAAMTYPLAWRRRQRMAIEGLAVGGRRRLGWLGQLLAGMGCRRPEERAVFAFIGQTMQGNQRYQTYLTMYGGVGLALAGTCAITMGWAQGATRLTVSNDVLHAQMPLLLFWMIAGLRTAFAFPVDMAAGWVFAACGVELGRCAEAARRWVFLHGVLLVVCVLAAQWAMHWDMSQLVVQALMGVSLACVLTDLFFAARRGIPFTRPRQPGKSNVAVTVGLYVAAFPYFVMETVEWSKWLEQRLVWLWVPVAAAVILRLALREMQRREGPVYELVEEELDGTMTLGIAQF